MKAAVLGSPIAHSKSPQLHSAAYRELALDWTYERYEVRAAELRDFLREHAGEFRGLSLTMPLKEEAFSIAEWKDEPSYATSACNTLVFDGELKGYNTDVVGFIAALRAAGIGNAESVCILGTGATARSAAVAMLRDGCRDIHVVGRRSEAIDLFTTWFASIGGDASGHMWAEQPLDTAITISTTPAGATDDRPLPRVAGTLFDVVYAPWPTAYAGRWAQTGRQILSGLDLLVHQAAEQVLLMTGTAAKERGRIVDAMYAAIDR